MVKNEKIKISVIIPVYNAGKYVEKCINSVLTQSYSNWELIAIDDGSSDNSWEILQGFAALDKRIIVESKSNEGPGITRNRCMEKASGDVFVFIDSDDYIESNYFSLLVDKIVNENADVVFINFIQETPEGRMIKYEKMSKFAGCDKKTLIGCQMTGYLPWGGHRKAARVSLVRNNNLKYGSASSGEEAIYSFELLRHSNKIVFIDKELYHYINRPSSQSKISSNSPTLQNMKKHLEDNGLIDEYRDCLNALAFTKLIQWLLEYANNYSLSDTLKCLKKKVSMFKMDFGWNLDTKYMRMELRLIYPFVKYKLLFPIALAAKLVNRS